MAKFKKGDKFGTTQSLKYEVLAGPFKSNTSIFPLYVTLDTHGNVELRNESLLEALEQED